ncbi:GNAT family N-acetyltransferase [Haladaptatus sp. ZSTT2]|uniref:GNAT family N-acetyltransferase n=1 Tax=Haladaptatus sp. ZSTT2 TaxID=3120515 RepID=UPI00300EE036
MTATTSIENQVPTAAQFLSLREAAGMAPRSREAVEQGLPNSVFGVLAVHDQTDEVVGMGRIVGDDGSVYHICDMAVRPEFQGQGLGTRIMDALMDYIEETAPPLAYVNLMADVDGFYERWGFEHTAPASKGMYLRTE